jgi:hypothetical protein
VFRTKILAMLMFLSLLSVVFVVPAGAEDKKPPFEISGFVDTYYSYNFNNPDSRFNAIGDPVNGPTGLSNFDFYHNSFNLSLVEVVIAKTAEPVGFRIDLDYGPTTDWVHCGNPNCDAAPNAESPYRYLQQAYVSWATPVGLNIDFGKFVTPIGAEVIESKDNWNYTRGLLFCCAIPYYHAGIRAGYTINGMFSVTGFLLNGWNNVIENNGIKTGAISLAITPTPKLPIVLNWIGPEKVPGVYSNRQLVEAIATFNATDAISFMADYNFGEEDLVGGGTARWSGIATYARWKVDPYALALRYEYVSDTSNVMFGGSNPDGNDVQEVTVTAEKTIASNLLTRVEYRNDFSHGQIFEDKDGSFTKNNQGRIVVSAVYMF